MNPLTKFYRLTRQDRRLLLQAYLALAISRVRLRADNIDALRTWSARPGEGTMPVDRLLWAVEVASRWMPGTTCLARALALQRLLALNGQCSDLRIGVEKKGDRFGAHAWLVQGDRVLIGDSGLDNFELLTAWTVSANASQSPPKRGDSA